MVKIPTRQDRIIRQPSPIDTGEGAVISSVIGAAQTAISIGKGIKDKNDQAKSAEQSSKLQIELYDDWNSFKKDNRGDPDLSKKFDAEFDKKIKKVQNDKSLNNTVKGNLSSFLNKQKVAFKDNTLREQDTQQIEEIATNIEEASLTNNVLFYKRGRDKDLEVLNSIDGIVSRNISVAEGVVSPKVLEDMKKTQVHGGFSNAIKGVASTDTKLAMQILNDDELLNKMTIEQIDSLKAYVRSIDKQKELNAKNALKIIKTPEEAARDIEIQNGIEADFLRFNIGKETDDDVSMSGVIKNDELNNVESLIDFRDRVREANSTQSLPETEYKKYMSETNNAMMVIFKKNKDKTTFFDWSSTVQENLMYYIDERANDPESKFSDLLDTGNFATAYEKTMKDLKEEEIDVTEDNSDSKDKMIKLLDENLEQQTRIRIGKRGANAVLVNGKVVPLDSEASNTTGVKLDNGGVQVGIIESGGKKYEVEVDSKGNILRTIREVQ